MKKQKLILGVAAFLGTASLLVVPTFADGSAAEQAGFTNATLYGCVITAYNQKTGEEKTTADKLTDAQLATIETLECKNKDIANATGIEKLTGLDTLDLSENKLTSIDLSKNVLLVNLNLYNNQLTSLDITKNPELTTLNIGSPITIKHIINSIDIKNNKKIENITTTGGQPLITDLKPQEKDGKLIVDLSPLLFISKSKQYVPTTSFHEYNFDETSFVAECYDGYNGYIELSLSELSNLGDGPKLILDTSGVTDPEKEDTGDKETDPKKEDDDKEDGKTTPSTPKTGIFGDDKSLVKFLPLIGIPTILLLGFAIKNAKNNKDRKIKFGKR